MMKKVAVISFTILLVLCSSCKFVKSKFFSKKVDTLSAFVDTLSQAEKTDSSVYQSTLAQVQQESQASADAIQSAPASMPDAHFYMIVGSFMVQKNAEKYAEKIKGMGYEGIIISGSGGFQMVSAKSYNNFKASVAEIDQFRSDVTPKAWVYVRK
jgi:hypothetical protein